MKHLSVEEIFEKAERNAEKRRAKGVKLAGIKKDTEYPTTIVNVEVKDGKTIFEIVVWANHKGVAKTETFNNDSQEFRLDAIREDACVTDVEDMVGCHYITEYVVEKGYKNWNICGVIEKDDVLDHIDELKEEFKKEDKKLKKAAKKDKEKRTSSTKKVKSLLEDDESEDTTFDDVTDGDKLDDENFEE